MSESAILTVTGMKCGGCETNVTGKLTALAGVKAVKAEHKENRVSVEFDGAQTSLEAIEQVIKAAGFDVE
ncbi:MAG: heavy-metal-associated domain-containing protein [Methylococcales bacterium]